MGGESLVEKLVLLVLVPLEEEDELLLIEPEPPFKAVSAAARTDGDGDLPALLLDFICI